jgi:hypothetical protein
MPPSSPRCRTRLALGMDDAAGIGVVESLNGPYRATIEPNDDVRPPIRVAPLDGSNGNMLILASDSGDPAGQPRLDRAMGPMQFIAETWRLYGREANNDGVVESDTSMRRTYCSRLFVPARWRPCHAAGLDQGAAGLQQLRRIRRRGARLGDRLREQPPATLTAEFTLLD